MLLSTSLLAWGLFNFSAMESELPYQTVRRFTLIVAAHDGGEQRAKLRYVESDADAFSNVFRTLGGVEPSDEYRLSQPTPDRLRAMFVELKSHLEAASKTVDRLELVMYYSGHSDAQGLLLGSERYTYEELKERLEQLPVDIHIAILDACASGAMTRQKGGVRRPAFTIDIANKSSGYAILTSSAENESAQESDRIGASVFTHFLVSALRGAADLSGDGQVTLNEAYIFAFHETLQRTINTIGGVQHPAYEIKLVGSGDIVMTDVRETNTTMSLGKEIYGRFYIQGPSGQLAAEILKIQGRKVVLGLMPGQYTIFWNKDETVLQKSIVLQKETSVEIVADEFIVTEGREPMVLRGYIDEGKHIDAEISHSNLKLMLDGYVAVIGLADYFIDLEVGGLGGGLEVGGTLTFADHLVSPVFGLSLGLTMTEDHTDYMSSYLKPRLGFEWGVNSDLELGFGGIFSVVFHHLLETVDDFPEQIQARVGLYCQSSFKNRFLPVFVAAHIDWDLNDIPVFRSGSGISPPPVDQGEFNLQSEGDIFPDNLNGAVGALLWGFEF